MSIESFSDKYPAIYPLFISWNDDFNSPVKYLWRKIALKYFGWRHTGSLPTHIGTKWTLSNESIGHWQVALNTIDVDLLIVWPNEHGFRLWPNDQYLWWQVALNIPVGRYPGPRPGPWSQCCMTRVYHHIHHGQYPQTWQQYFKKIFSNVQLILF